jgi:glucose/mannose-6-phosphate isomerase
MRMAQIDRSGMLDAVAALGRQLEDGFEIGRSTLDLPSGDGLHSVVICGMGGSGISGDVVRALYADRLGLPVLVVKGYRLPEFCTRESLVMASSFSGNTEETLACYREALARGCRVVAITAGGELAELSQADDVARVILPDRAMMPRAALGYLAGAPMGVLQAMGMVPAAGSSVRSAAMLLDRMASELRPEEPAESNEARAIAEWLGDRVPVIWGSEGVAEVAALRWKAQFNENAKRPAFVSVLPELDHNEIEGWTPGTGATFGAIVLRHPGEHPRVEVRVRATLEAVAESGLSWREVHADGSSPLEWLFSLVMLGDFTSVYAALQAGVDPSPVPALSGLKKRLRP